MLHLFCVHSTEQTSTVDKTTRHLWVQSRQEGLIAWREERAAQLYVEQLPCGLVGGRHYELGAGMHAGRQACGGQRKRRATSELKKET
jgi:hypothetical protein